MYKKRRPTASIRRPSVVLVRNVRAYKPNLVYPGQHRRVGAGEVIIYLGRLSPTASSGLPAPLSGVTDGRPDHRRATFVLLNAGKPARSTRCDLAFHPVGFAWPAPSPEPPVRSYRTLSPLSPTVVGTRSRDRGGSALCCTCLPHRLDNDRRRCSLPVRKHGALWCSDFPHRGCRRSRDESPTSAPTER